MSSLFADARKAKRQIVNETLLDFEAKLNLPAEDRFGALGIELEGGRFYRLLAWDYNTYRAMKRTIQAAGKKVGFYGASLERACYEAHNVIRHQPVTIDDFAIVAELCQSTATTCLEIFRQEYLALMGA